MAGHINRDIHHRLKEYDLNGKKVARIYVTDSREGMQLSKMEGIGSPRELEKLLTRSGFTAVYHENLTDDELKADLLSVKQDTEDIACLWVFVFARTDAEFVSCELGCLSIKELWRTFAADEFENMSGKPKMFFIQAETDNEDPFVPLMSKAGGESGEDKFLRSIPISADVMVAVFPGKGREEHLPLGSFISDVLRNPEPQSIYSMMAYINGKAWSHAPRYSTTFRKQLYLPPQREDADLISGAEEANTSRKQYSFARGPGKRLAYSFVFKCFKYISSQEGAEADKKAIKEAAERRGFTYVDCNPHWTLTTGGMLQKLRDIAANKENADCVIIFFSTHGRMNFQYVPEIFAYDYTLSVSDLWAPFVESTGLKGKPKAFIIDAGLGPKLEKGAKTGIESMDIPNIVETTATEDSDQKQSSLEGQQSAHGIEAEGGDNASQMQDETRNEEMLHEIPHGSDMLIGIGTVKGKKANRNVQNGYPYMQEFCRRFGDLSGSSNLLDILIATNETVSEMKIEKKNGIRYQMPTFTSSLRKEWIL
ncbi:uncharacterized protein LOC124161300 [Ischnura elegans]|uniref:uncharacterized protein LOC124161300 n=1 Tax=Ischnura elegans TaxID=197161 RepID=UPI001ED87F34|nr:uncharacterized protein LOC124161300 [Ischnura elegans]